ncbi:MAG: MaoC family dehydratase [Natronomonas sp.]
MPRYYEDLTVGDVYETGDYEITETEIREFGAKYDPQPFHTDPEAAEDGPFDGLVASGWNTAGVTMRLMVEDFIDPETSLGGRGVDNLRWQRPVRPGDVLTAEIEVLSKRPSEGRPGVGHVRVGVTGFVDGDRVISWEGLTMVERRGSE